MVKNHIKRMAAPSTWDIKKKTNKFIIKPKPCGLSFKLSIPVLVLFRDLLKRVKTKKEMKYILNNKEVLLNGKRIKSYELSVGLMDVISVPETKLNYRILLNKKGKLFALEIDNKDSSLLPLWIKNKKIIKGKKTQLNFSNGFVLNVDKDDYKTGDVIIYDFSTKKIINKYGLKKDSFVYFIAGKNIGKTAIVQEINEDNYVFKKDDEVFVVNKKNAKINAFVLGEKKSSIKLE
jgi:small subunit ribosomal protein S4e